MAQNPKRISKWVRRGVIGLLGLTILVIVAPFAFPTAAARLVLRHSGLAPYTPTVGSASLSLGGRVTLRDVVLHEPGRDEKEMLRVGVVEGEFSWAGVMRSKVERIRARDIGVHVQAMEGTVEAVTFEGMCDGGAGWCEGGLEVTNVNLGPAGGTADAKNAMRLRRCGFSGAVSGPLDGTFLKQGSIENGRLRFALFGMGSNTLENVDAPVTLSGGMLATDGVRATFAGGDFAGLIRYSARDRHIAAIHLTVQHLDQKQVAANLAPERLDAEGTLSGTIDLAAGERSVLKGKIELKSDQPGHLRIKDEAAAKALAQQLEVGDQSGLLPPNFSQVVVGQLRDYPYTEASIRVIDRDGTPVVALDYARESVKPGEAGYDVPTTFQGRPIRANYTIQLPGVKVVLKGKTIDELLAEATGFAKQLTKK